MKTVEGKTKRVKKGRVNFSQRQLEALETVFKESQYPDVVVLEGLAKRMDLQIEKVCTWFQNRRSKFRKESKSGHIQWMRSQLFSNKSQEPTNQSKPAPAKDDHVLIPSDAIKKDVDSKVPSVSVHHMSATKTPVISSDPLGTYPNTCAQPAMPPQNVSPQYSAHYSSQHYDATYQQQSVSPQMAAQYNMPQEMTGMDAPPVSYGYMETPTPTSDYQWLTSSGADYSTMTTCGDYGNMAGYYDSTYTTGYDSVPTSSTYMYGHQPTMTTSTYNNGQYCGNNYYYPTTMYPSNGQPFPTNQTPSNDVQLAS